MRGHRARPGAPRPIRARAERSLRLGRMRAQPADQQPPTAARPAKPAAPATPVTMVAVASAKVPRSFALRRMQTAEVILGLVRAGPAKTAVPSTLLAAAALVRRAFLARAVAERCAPAKPAVTTEPPAARIAPVVAPAFASEEVGPWAAAEARAIPTAAPWMPRAALRPTAVPSACASRARRASTTRAPAAAPMAKLAVATTLATWGWVVRQAPVALVAATDKPAAAAAVVPCVAGPALLVERATCALSPPAASKVSNVASLTREMAARVKTLAASTTCARLAAR
jgi:hypothetical protein